MFQNLTNSKVKTVSDTILENIIDLWIVSLNQLLAETVILSHNNGFTIIKMWKIEVLITAFFLKAIKPCYQNEKLFLYFSK